jgi:hypothetical protein
MSVPGQRDRDRFAGPAADIDNAQWPAKTRSFTLQMLSEKAEPLFKSEGFDDAPCPLVV